jgi:hypothetical protein
METTSVHAPAQAKAIAYCPDCGPETVPHWIQRLSVRISTVLDYVTMPLEYIRARLTPIAVLLRPGRMAPAFAMAFAAIGFGRIVTEPDDQVNWRTRVVWDEAKRRGIVMKEFRPFGLAREIFYATYGSDTLTFDGVPRPRGAHATSLNWMDNKGIIIEKFRAEGIPVPQGRSCSTVAQAEEEFKKILTNGRKTSLSTSPAAIVKPTLGSRSRHTYIHLTNLASLRQAFLKAKELSPYVVVEQELIGFVFRITLVDGKVAGVMRREPPHVIGDGKHSVHWLADEENKNPLRHGPIFHELSLGEEAVAELAKQGMTFDSVPANGAMVLLHEKVSRSFGASNTEIETADIHPDNQALFLKIARVLDDPLVGVDFIIEDVARSWRDQTCGVIECNSLPFIDLHLFPLKGPTRNVAGDVWNMIWPGSDPDRNVKK